MSARTILAITGATALTLLAAVPAATPAGAADTVGSFIVQFSPGSDRAAEVAKAKALGMTVTYEYSKVMNGMAVLANKGQLTALEKNPNVTKIDADGIATVSDTQNGATWGLDRIDQRVLPLDSTYSYPTSKGSGVTAYIIDTGINVNHTEFAGRTATGYDAVTPGGSAADCNGHGTHVAGTVGGSTYGVAKGVTLVPVRVLDCTGSGSFSGVIAGIDWVAANATKPAVANMSLGGGYYAPVNTAVANAIAAGVTFGVAGGNESTDACTKSPASTPEAITVGATTNTDARASYSNFGTCLDIFAPGSSITSSWYTSNTATNTISGTSMATPHVVGAAALYLGANPQATPLDVRNALVANGTTGVVGSAGTGSPNVLLFVNGGPVAPPAAPTISGFSPASGAVGASVTISGTNLTGATAVKFGSTTASFMVNSPTQITATVPPGATTSTISVTTLGGTATSSGSFTVVVLPSAPTSLRTTSVTQTSGTVTWSAPSTIGTLVRYEVRLGTGAWVTANGGGSHTFTGLRRNTAYSWSVRAVDNVGTGASASATLRTVR